MTNTPTTEDRQKAAIWMVAKSQDAGIWRLLSNEQKAMVDARIEWAMGHSGNTPGSGRAIAEPSPDGHNPRESGSDRPPS